MSQLARFVAGIGTRLDGDPLVVMLDVDGTLAPIVPRPADARVPADTRAVLDALAGMPRVAVALVSGRSAEDTMRVAPVSKAWVVGNHGFEVRSPDGQVKTNNEAVPYEHAVADAASWLEPITRATEGAILENKRWTLSLHYRLVSPHEVEQLLARAREVALAAGLRVTEGKKIVELRPPVEIDKGTAALALAEELGAVNANASAMFAGDDRTDEDAFRALRLRKPDAITARILGAGDEEAAGSTNAEFALASPAELREFLRWLLKHRRDGRFGAGG